MVSFITGRPALVVVILCLLALAPSCRGSGRSSESAEPEDAVGDLAGLRFDVRGEVAAPAPPGVIPGIIPGIPTTAIPPEEEKRRKQDLRRFRRSFVVAEPTEEGVAGPPYRVIGLGSGRCTSISPDGLLVAETTDQGALRPFLVGANGVRRELPAPEGFAFTVPSRPYGVSGTLGGTFSLAVSINNAGDVAGYSELEPGVPIRHVAGRS